MYTLNNGKATETTKREHPSVDPFILLVPQKLESFIVSKLKINQNYSAVEAFGSQILGNLSFPSITILEKLLLVVKKFLMG